MAALNKENCEELLRSNLAQNSNVPRSQEDYITQVSDEIEGRVTEELPQELSRTKNRILGALARLDDFPMNPLNQGHSRTAPETSRNAFSTSQGTNEDDSQSDPHPEAGIFHNRTTQNSGPGYDHDMVTGATEQIGNRHDMTGVHEEVTYCSPGTSSGKQKRTVLSVNRNSAAKRPLRQSNQNNFCWPFSSWQMTTILRTFTIKSAEFPKCHGHSPQRCPRLWENLRNLSCLKIYSRRASNIIFT